MNEDILNLSRYSLGKSFLKNCSLEPQEVWRIILNAALEQDFLIGVKFSEPSKLILS